MVVEGMKRKGSRVEVLCMDKNDRYDYMNLQNNYKRKRGTGGCR